MFGELDDVTPYTKLGKKHRLSTDYLFDVSNLNEDGSIAELTSHRAAMNKVNQQSLYFLFSSPLSFLSHHDLSILLFPLSFS